MGVRVDTEAREHTVRGVVNAAMEMLNDERTAE